MGFFDGLKETILAGVDGYVAIETSKNNAVEATPPAPTNTVTQEPGGYNPGIIETMTANSSQMLLFFGGLLAVAVFIKAR